jgi:hypothetical protein
LVLLIVKFLSDRELSYMNFIFNVVRRFWLWIHQIK